MNKLITEAIEKLNAAFNTLYGINFPANFVVESFMYDNGSGGGEFKFNNEGQPEIIVYQSALDQERKSKLGQGVDRVISIISHEYGHLVWNVMKYTKPELCNEYADMKNPGMVFDAELDNTLPWVNKITEAFCEDFRIYLSSHVINNVPENGTVYKSFDVIKFDNIVKKI